MLLTGTQKPADWLPWIPFQVFLALLSTSTQHHGLMAFGSVCLCASMHVWCMCTDVGVRVCVLSILMLSVSRMTKDFSSCHTIFSLSSPFPYSCPSQCHNLPFALRAASFDFSPSLPLRLTSSSPSSPGRQSDFRRSEWPACFGPAAHLSGSALFCVLRGKDCGDQETERK